MRVVRFVNILARIPRDGEISDIARLSRTAEMPGERTLRMRRNPVASLTYIYVYTVARRDVVWNFCTRRAPLA